MKQEMPSVILATDSYKTSHFPLYPPEMEGLYSYIEARWGETQGVVFYAALNYALRKYLGNEITIGDIIDAERFMGLHGEPFNKKGWDKILNSCYGQLPLTVYAVPEGTLVPLSVPMMAVKSEMKGLESLASYVETWLLRSTWYGSTVATYSFNCKRIIKKYLEETGDVSLLPFKLHDFGK